MIVPCIEIRDGRAAEAPGGARGGVEELLGLMEPLARCGDPAIMDMDAEDLSGDNAGLVSAACSRFPCWVGGGIRNADRARAVLRSGAEKIVLSAVTGPELLDAFRPEHVLLELRHDASGGSGELEKVLAQTRGRCSGYLIRSGEQAKTDPESLRRLSMLTEAHLVVGGDDLTVEEIATLDRMGVDVLVGKPLLEKKISCAEAVVACMRWDDEETLPTVVVDAAGQVLMVAPSSPRSLETALSSGEGTYHDSARGGLWRKGERSGNDQLVLRCRPARDRRSILLTVRQAGNAHETGYSYFGDREFNLDFLSRIAASKRSSDPSSSYTARLLDDPQAIEARIREKVRSVVKARNRDETLWAVADLVYFLVVKAVSRNLTWSDVVRELRGRQR